MAFAGCIRGFFVAALLALGLCSCAIIDQVDPRHDTINRASANARNESILLNIVRASHNVPLNFIAFSRVSGTHNVQASGGLPLFGLGSGPLVQTVNRQAIISSGVFNANTAAINTFDIGLLESKDFYNGLLSPVDLATLNFFTRQGYSRQLLFWLFTESVRETVHDRTYEYRNEPILSQSCDGDFPSPRPRCFRDMMDLALASGLTVQTETETRVIAGRPQVVVYGRMCFDAVLARRARVEYSPDVGDSLRASTGHRPRCTDPWARQQSGDKPSDDGTRHGTGDTLTFEVAGSRFGTIQYAITTRSTFGIYRFLGSILRSGGEGAITVRGRRDLSEPEHIPLLEVRRDTSDGCFVDLHFDGFYYCVPRRGADNTKHIFSLLAQLIALRTQPGDLAITPSVRVTP